MTVYACFGCFSRVFVTLPRSLELQSMRMSLPILSLAIIGVGSLRYKNIDSFELYLSEAALIVEPPGSTEIGLGTATDVFSFPLQRHPSLYCLL